MLKKIVLKIAPKTYIALARAKVELWDQYQTIKSIPHAVRISGCNLLNYILCYLRHGATPFEFLCLDFACKNSRGRKEYVTMRRNRRLDSHFNDKEANKILWDKSLFNNYFSEFIHHKFVSVNNDTTEQELRDFWNALSEKRFIVKPNDLFYGQGVYIAESLDELFFLKSSGKKYIVEELVNNTPELAVLNESSLNTFRVVTCIDNKGEIHIVTILLRTGKKGAVIDNLLAGGTCYHVDPQTGIVDGLGKDGFGNTYLKHPSSGVVMPGFRVSRIDEVKWFAIGLAKHLESARYVGWDIALTPNGIDVIEGNVCPSAELIQCNGNGLLRELKSYI